MKIMTFLTSFLLVLALLLGCGPKLEPTIESTTTAEVTLAPAEFTVSGFSVTPSDVKIGEQVTVSLVVTNTGGSEGSYAAILKINDAEESRKEISIGSGQSQTIDFVVVRDREGSYKVSIDDKIGQFTVSIPTTAVTLTTTISGPPFTENKSAIAQMVFPVSTNITEISYVEPDVIYGVAGGVELKMDIYYPKQCDANVPVVVYVHGGAFQGGDKRDGMVARWMPEIVSRGYMVASLNYRVVSQGGTFPYQVEDVKTAVRWLRANTAKYRIDTNKIGVIGVSSGGYLVNMMGLCDDSAGFDNSGGYLNQSSRVQAVVDLFGPTDFTLQFDGPDGAHSKFLGGADKFYEIAPEASPINYVSPDDPPFLIIHGDKDPTVIPKHSELLYEKLITANVPATLVWIKNGGHGFVPVGTDPISPTGPEVLEITVDFFDKYLKTGTDTKTTPNYTKQAQYEYSATLKYDQIEWSYLAR